MFVIDDIVYDVCICVCILYYIIVLCVAA